MTVLTLFSELRYGARHGAGVHLLLEKARNLFPLSCSKATAVHFDI